jgi:DNA-binding NarL/FixJ family response regulator
MSAESVPALSDREEEVLQLLTLGARNARIAEELGISVNTVRTHVSSVLGKLGVDSRGQAAHVAAGASTLRDGPLLMARTMHSSNGTGAPHRRLAIVLVLVDGHRAFVEAVALQLRVTMPGLKVRLARTTEEAQALVGEEVADLVILHDEKRPDDALHGVKELGRRDGAARCLVLSGRDDPTDVVHALRAGSSGWISRDVSLDELDEAIRQVAQDRLYLSPPVLSEVLRALLVPGPDRRLEHDFVDSLSSRELEILRCLMAGMTRREIAGRLFLSIHTVHSHVKRMLNRADQHSALSLVAMARQLGVTPIDRDDASPFPTQPRAVDGSPLAAN